MDVLYGEINLSKVFYLYFLTFLFENSENPYF